MEGVDHVIDELRQDGYQEFYKEVTISADGTKVRVDIVTIEKDGTKLMIEVKNGVYSHLTPNQSIAYPKMMFDHPPIIPLGNNAANVWNTIPIGQPVSDYEILIIKIY